MRFDFSFLCSCDSCLEERARALRSKAELISCARDESSSWTKTISLTQRRRRSKEKAQGGITLNSFAFHSVPAHCCGDLAQRRIHSVERSARARDVARSELRLKRF